jgi:hypothetical protein
MPLLKNPLFRQVVHDNESTSIAASDKQTHHKLIENTSYEMPGSNRMSNILDYINSNPHVVMASQV